MVEPPEESTGSYRRRFALDSVASAGKTCLATSMAALFWMSAADMLVLARFGILPLEFGKFKEVVYRACDTCPTASKWIA